MAWLAGRDQSVACLGMIASLAALGCAKILGVDAYSVARPDAAASGEKFLSSTECRNCLNENCNAYQQACATSKACGKTLACRRRCSDPACHLACVATYQSEADDEQARDGAPFDPGSNQPGPVQFDDLNSCAFNSCNSQCQLGRNYACVGKYSPQQRPPTNDVFTLPLDVNLFAPSVSPPISNMKVSACGVGPGLCDPPLAPPEEIIDGHATLHWTRHGGTGDESLEFENDGTDAGSVDGGTFGGLPLHTRFIPSFPFVDGVRQNILLSSQSAAAGGVTFLYDAAFGPEDTPGYVQLWDCDLQGGPGLVLSVSGQPRADQAKIAYWGLFPGGESLPMASLTESVTGGVTVNFVPAGGPFLFEARDTRTQRVVASSLIFMFAGWGYQLYLYPLTESQAQELGD